MASSTIDRPVLPARLAPAAMREASSSATRVGVLSLPNATASERGRVVMPAQAASNTRPPNTVPHTPTSFKAVGATCRGSSSSTAKSARLPHSMLPIS